MSFFCFDEFLGVLKSRPYIRVYNTVFFTDFFPGCPTCKASNNSMHRLPESLAPPASHDE